MNQSQSINGNVFQIIDGHAVGSLIFPKGDFQAAVLSIVPQNRAGEHHPQKLNRLVEHTQAWDEKVIELLTVADLTAPELIELMYRISGTPQSTTYSPTASNVRPTLGKYMNIRILYHVTADGKLQLPAAIAETRNVIGQYRDVILHRNSNPMLGILDNGRLYTGIGQINKWTRRIYDERIREVLARETVPYNASLDDTQRFFAPGRAIGLETRLYS